jgi:L-ascorbate metabolism protein UlaG (beta-lactamase superfamily)
LGSRSLLKWLSTRQKGPWRPYTDAPPGPPPPYRVGEGKVRVTFVGHATALIQQDRVNVLTDPIWSTVASPFPPIGPTRARPPGLRFEDLPPIDAVLVSHDHYDHLDVPTLKRLKHAFPRLRIYAGLGVGAVLASAGVDGAIELDWWQSAELAPGVRVTAVPEQHFSNRGLFDRDRTLWAGFVVQGPAGATYFGGDTGYGPHFAATRERLGPMRVALLPIGAFRPQWFMSPVHESPSEAMKAAADLGARTTVPMHYGTFALADDGQDEPLAELGAAPGFAVLGFGEGRDLP